MTDVLTRGPDRPFRCVDFSPVSKQFPYCIEIGKQQNPLMRQKSDSCTERPFRCLEQGAHQNPLNTKSVSKQAKHQNPLITESVWKQGNSKIL